MTGRSSATAGLPSTGDRIAQNYAIYEFDCARWRSEGEMYAEIGRVLHFSDWWDPSWGQNLDALNDCLTDLPIRTDGGAALVLNRFNAYASGSGSALMHSARREAEVILDVMAGASHFFLLNGKRFLVLVQTEDPSFQVGAPGGRSPVWNRREWLTSK